MYAWTLMLPPYSQSPPQVYPIFPSGRKLQCLIIRLISWKVHWPQQIREFRSCLPVPEFEQLEFSLKFWKNCNHRVKSLEKCLSDCFSTCCIIPGSKASSTTWILKCPSLNSYLSVSKGKVSFVVAVVSLHCLFLNKKFQQTEKINMELICLSWKTHREKRKFGSGYCKTFV